jgi:flagellar biosynthesis/type III secretory pathway protein FliH
LDVAKEVWQEEASEKALKKGIEIGQKKGMAKGVKIGQEKGMAKGRQTERRDFLKLIRKGYSAKEIEKILLSNNQHK